MIDIIYRSKRVFESKDKSAKAKVAYEIGEMRSVAGVSIAIIANKAIIDVVCTFEDAVLSINNHWEKVKEKAIDKIIDKELKAKRLIK